MTPKGLWSMLTVLGLEYGRKYVVRLVLNAAFGFRLVYVSLWKSQPRVLHAADSP